MLKSLSQRDIEYGVNISLKHEFMYVETAKVGCSTLKASLQKMEYLSSGHVFNPKPSEVHNKRISPLLSPFQVDRKTLVGDILNSRDFFKFAFVRNPYTRALSCYLDKFERNEPEKAYFIELSKSKGLDLNYENISFLDFLKGIKEQTSIESDRHWRSLTDSTFYNDIDYNFIGYFENLDSDWAALTRLIYPRNLRAKATMDVRVSNKTSSEERLEKYYTDKVIQDLVVEIYEKDFENFGYSTDL